MQTIIFLNPNSHEPEQMFYRGHLTPPAKMYSMRLHSITSGIATFIPAEGEGMRIHVTKMDLDVATCTLTEYSFASTIWWEPTPIEGGCAWDMALLVLKGHPVCVIKGVRPGKEA